MITLKDNVEQFKRDLKSMKYYQARLNELELKLEEVHRIMYEPKSIRYGEDLGNGSYSFIDMMEQEQILMNEVRIYNSILNSIECRLNMIPNEKDKEMIEDVYCNHVNHEKVACKYGYTRVGMYRHINKILSEIF